MRPQDLASGASFVALGATVWALVTRQWWLAVGFALAVVAADLGSRWLSRRLPSHFRARFRFVLVHPRSERQWLVQALDPRPGEHILELGPGKGQHAVEVAVQLGPDGRLDVLDLQPEMLAAVERRAARRSLTNIVTTEGNACGRLPYDDASFDAAYLFGVFGELPDPDLTLRELGRVLKDGGRLVVGEVRVLDPDYVSLPRLRRRAEVAGFGFQRRSGSAAYYLACFTAASAPPDSTELEAGADPHARRTEP